MPHFLSLALHSLGQNNKRPSVKENRKKQIFAGFPLKMVIPNVGCVFFGEEDWTVEMRELSLFTVPVERESKVGLRAECNRNPKGRKAHTTKNTNTQIVCLTPP